MVVPPGTLGGRRFAGRQARQAGFARRFATYKRAVLVLSDLERLGAILTRGDSEEPEELFREFMGRDPELQPLLDRNFGSPLEIRSRAPSAP